MDPSSYNQPQAGANPGIPQAQQQAYAAPQGTPMMPNAGAAFNAQQPPMQQPAPPVPPSAQPQYQQLQVPTQAQPGPAPQPMSQVVGAPGAPAAGVPGVKPVQSNPNSTQNTLQIAEIRDGIVIMSDGSFRSVVMVKSINFDLMSQREQESVEYSYQGFLNSLYFPIQIFIRSEKVDLQPYIERLDKIPAIGAGAEQASN